MLVFSRLGRHSSFETFASTFSVRQTVQDWMHSWWIGGFDVLAVHPSIRPSNHPSIQPSVHPSILSIKSNQTKQATSQLLNQPVTQPTNSTNQSNMPGITIAKVSLWILDTSVICKCHKVLCFNETFVVREWRHSITHYGIHGTGIFTLLLILP